MILPVPRTPCIRTTNSQDLPSNGFGVAFLLLLLVLLLLPLLAAALAACHCC